MEKFTLKAALEAAARGEIEEWVHAFLESEGNNRSLSEGLKQKQRHWLGPIEVEISELKRIVGPEEGMEYVESAEDWTRRVGKIQSHLQEGWAMPPLIVQNQGGSLSVRDGNHRMGALENLGKRTCWIIIWDDESIENIKVNTFTSPLRERLAATAEHWAARPLIGNEHKYGPDLEPILRYFPREHPDIGFDWCAAFVYHCCLESGLELPVRYSPPVSRNFAWVEAWMEWAELYGFYHKFGESEFVPARGDLIVFDNLLGNGPNDHIGVVIRTEQGQLFTAEGNYHNRSGIFDRTDIAVNGYIRIVDAQKSR